MMMTLKTGLVCSIMVLLAGCQSTTNHMSALQASDLDAILSNPAPQPNWQALGYEPIAGGKYRLTRDMKIQTTRFGQATLSKGFESDGSSSPIKDTNGSRIAGFLHDALYSASGHLSFSRAGVRNWTKAQADDEYCELMARLNVSYSHRTANCLGVKNLKRIKTAWDRLSVKRKARWATATNS